MNPDTVAACRAALLKACRVTDAIIGVDREGMPIESVCVNLDDAAACLARAIEALAELETVKSPVSHPSPSEES